MSTLKAVVACHSEFLRGGHDLFHQDYMGVAIGIDS